MQDLPDWINAIGLIMSYLPDIFLDGLKKRLVSTLTSPPLSQWNLPQNPFDVFNFNDVHSVSGSTASSRYRRTILTFIEIIIQLHTCTVELKNLCTIRYLWSKTTLVIGRDM